MDLNSALLLWLFFLIIGIIIQVWVIRAGSRSTETVELLKGICESQNKQFLLLQKVIEEKLAIHISDDVYYHTKALDEVKTYSANDVFHIDNTLNNQIVVKLAILYQQHKRELRWRGLETPEAVATFKTYIESFAKSLTGEQWTTFLERYNKEIQVIRE